LQAGRRENVVEHGRGRSLRGISGLAEMVGKS
jgi:hypothetical protein